jgi:hypothetical protein
MALAMDLKTDSGWMDLFNRGGHYQQKITLTTLLIQILICKIIVKKYPFFSTLQKAKQIVFEKFKAKK